MRPAFSIRTAKTVNIFLWKQSNHARLSVNKNCVFWHTNLTVEGSFTQVTHLISVISWALIFLQCCVCVKLIKEDNHNACCTRHNLEYFEVSEKNVFSSLIGYKENSKMKNFVSWSPKNVGPPFHLWLWKISFKRLQK